MGHTHNGTLASLAALLLAGMTTTCAEPVHDTQVKSLGAQDPNGIPDNEFHRAGQPCLACHGFYGPASKRFSVAGTVFVGPDKAVGANKVTVTLVDSGGSHREATTNCVGNFAIDSDWNPAFPLKVGLRAGTHTAAMGSAIGREGSCAQCHQQTPSFDSPGNVHILPTEPDSPPQDLVASDCPYSNVTTSSYRMRLQ